MTDIMVETVDFVQRQESSAVKQAMQAVKALHDALALRERYAFPSWTRPERQSVNWRTRSHSLRLESLRSPQPGQLMFPGMDDASSASGTVPEPDGHCGVSAVITVLPA